jgi:PAS domain S-box-containing protein
MKRVAIPVLLFVSVSVLLTATVVWHVRDDAARQDRLAAAVAPFAAGDQGVGVLRELESLARDPVHAGLARRLIAQEQQRVERDAVLVATARAPEASPGLVVLALAALSYLFLTLALVIVRARRAARNAGRADDALRSLRSLLAAAPMAFVAWSRESGVTLWSDSAERMFGIERERVLGSPLPEAMAPLREEVERALTSSDASLGLPVSLRGDQGERMHLLVSASRMELQVPGESTIAAVIEDMTPHRLLEARRLDAVRAQRDALIREVHHRIKNHLQGVAGLLRQHLAGKPLLQPLLEAATAQVLTIAAVHGLQGEVAGHALDLRSMVSRIAASISGIMHVPIVLGDSCAELEGLCLTEDEAVPVAMVLNEVLMNAVKHRARDGSDALIRVGARLHDGEVGIRVSNQGFLPPRFDFASGAQIGTGLGLVKSLLPQEGARLEIAEEGDLVVATLTLSAPHLCFAAVVRARDAVALED